jgi:hypothetical protein
MTKYRVTDTRTGKEVAEGDTVTDFRGDTVKFVSVTRGVEYNGTAKVLVEWPDEYRNEYYANVFELDVVTLDNEA